jgi:uncharacterized membrane protein (UPF0127 family)
MKIKGINTVFILAVIAVAAVVVFFIMNEKESGPNFIEQDSAPTFKKEGELLFINTTIGDTLAAIDIEIADNEQKTAQGLMYRSSMPQNAGMLFLMPNEEVQGFWMRNTYIPLDMIFINSKMEIVTIHRNTTPMLESSYISTAPALYVVEVNAGFCSKNNINEGDKIDYTTKK